MKISSVDILKIMEILKGCIRDKHNNNISLLHGQATLSSAFLN